MTVPALIQRADEARDNGHIAVAEQSYREALSLSPSVDQELHCRQMLGVCRRQVCDFAGAVQFYNEAASFAYAHGFSAGGIKRDQAIVLMLQGDLAGAHALYNLSVSFLVNGPRDQLGITHIKWGYCMLLQGNKALAYLQIRTGMAMAEKNTFFLGTGYIHLAEVMIACQEFEQAIHLLEHARQIFASPAKIWCLTEVYGFKAICHTHLGDRDAAEFALERSQSLMEKAKMPEESKIHLARTLRFEETARLISQL